MTTLARLHAALDSIVEAREVLDEVLETAPRVSPGIARVTRLLAESQEIVRGVLTRRPPDAGAHE